MRDLLTVVRYARRGSWLRLLKKVVDLLTPSDTDWRETPEYRRWRDSVLQRDNHRCQDCYRSEQEVGCLHAHHILRAHSHPDKRYDVNNGVALCPECHATRHRRAGETSIANLLESRTY